MNDRMLGLQSSPGGRIALMPNSPLACALAAAGGLRLLEREALPSRGDPRTVFVNPARDEGPTQAQLLLEARGLDVVVSPVLDGRWLCTTCWRKRRLSAWASGMPLQDADFHALERRFLAAANPLRAQWTDAQLYQAGQLLRARLRHDGEEDGGRCCAHVIGTDGQVREEYVLPRPDCDPCAPHLRASRYAHLDTQARLGVLDGAAAGIITAPADLPALPGEPELPFVCTGHAANTWLHTAPGTLHVYAGKGWTPGQARLSAYGEGVERYCASFVPLQNLVIARAETLALPHLPPGALHGMEATQANLALLARPDEDTAWTSVAADDGAQVYAPADAVYTRTAPGLPCAMPRTTNGLACAPSLEDARLRARVELWERHFFLQAWYGGGPVDDLDDALVVDEAARTFIAQCAATGLAVRLQLCCPNRQACVVMASLRDLKGAPGRPAWCVGLGVGAVPREAATAALLEVGQVYRKLTHALLDPAIAERARDLANGLRVASEPFDHALQYVHRPPECNSAQPHRPKPAPPARVFSADVTTSDIAALLSWRVARALSPDLLPYHVGVATIPWQKLGRRRRPFVSGLHPLC